MPKKPGFKKGASGDNPDRIKDAGDKSKRDRSTIQRLRMYRSGKPVRNKQGVWRRGFEEVLGAWFRLL